MKTVDTFHHLYLLIMLSVSINYFNKLLKAFCMFTLMEYFSFKKMYNSVTSSETAQYNLLVQ